MTLEFTPLHPSFVSEASRIALREVDDQAVLDAIRDAMDEHAVVVFRDQAFEDDEQLDLRPPARRGAAREDREPGDRGQPDGQRGADRRLERGRRRRVAGAGRPPAPVLPRQPPLAHRRLFRESARAVLPPARPGGPAERPATEFADMRAAYDALDDRTRERIEGLEVHHSIAWSRSTLGFEFTPEEAEILWGAIQPLVRTFPRCGRRSLYLASHASRILGWTLPEGRLLLRDLMEHATQREFVYAHQWRAGDLVIYDNRATMHRARPFDDGVLRRELRRVTTLDVDG